MIGAKSRHFGADRQKTEHVSTCWLCLSLSVLGWVGVGCAPRPGNVMEEPSRDAQVLQALRLAASDHPAAAPPTPASHERGRWEDIDLAVYWAVAEPGVELATVRRRDFEWGFIYDLKTIEGWPGVLIIERVDGPRVYEARASIGRFLNTRASREQALINAIDRWMRALGRKRR